MLENRVSTFVLKTESEKGGERRKEEGTDERYVAT